MSENTNKDKLMDQTVNDQLKNAGIKYVRWAYAGSNDQGGIVEAKLFDRDEQPIREISIYDYELEAEGLDKKILKIGERHLEKIGGFEINDGGYGWILLDTDSGEMLMSNHYNECGIGSEYFDNTKFDRVEFIYNDDWTANQSDLEAIEVKILYVDPENEIVLTNDQKSNFLSCQRQLGKSKKKNFFDAGGKILFTVNGPRLRETIDQLGLSVDDRLYYWAENVETGDSMSRTPDDTLVEITISKPDPYPDTLAVVFLSGWCDSFTYNVKDETNVSNESPTPKEMLHENVKER